MQNKRYHLGVHECYMPYHPKSFAQFAAAQAEGSRCHSLVDSMVPFWSVLANIGQALWQEVLCFKFAAVIITQSSADSDSLAIQALATSDLEQWNGQGLSSHLNHWYVLCNLLGWHSKYSIVYSQKWSAA